MHGWAAVIREGLTEECSLVLLDWTTLTFNKVMISFDHLDSGSWCLSFFEAFYHTFDSVRGWAAVIRQGLTEACFFSGDI